MDQANVGLLLTKSHGGDRQAFDALYARLYDELRSAARGQLRRYGRRGTLDTSALVHEAYLRLVGAHGIPWTSRAHFLAIAARAMRRAAIDYVRGRNARKRGGRAPHVTLSTEVLGVAGDPETLIAIDAALAGLAEFNDRLPQVAECRLFGGLTEAETAQALGVSVRTVQRDWKRARAWLQQELSEGSER